MKNPYIENIKYFTSTKDALHYVGGIPEVTSHTLKSLKAQGLQPYHTLLDVGAGCFRMHTVIDYLNQGHYFAIEGNSSLVNQGLDYLKEKGVDKVPIYTVNQDFEIGLLEEPYFDFVLISGVVCHMTDDEIEHMFSKLFQFTAHHTKVIVTFIDNNTVDKNFRGTPYTHLKTFLPDEYESTLISYYHPRGLKMMMITRTINSA